MASRSLIRFLFVLYCIEVGVLLALAPWSPNWDRAVVQLPLDSLRLALLHPAVRGAFTGFGLVHLVWGAHDLDLWLLARSRRHDARP